MRNRPKSPLLRSPHSLARAAGFRENPHSVACDPTAHRHILLSMTYEQLPDEWKTWLDLAPLERLAQSERMLVEYLAMGGSLDPDPDPTSPFDVPEEWRPDLAHGRAGMRLLRRGAG